MAIDGRTDLGITKIMQTAAGNGITAVLQIIALEIVRMKMIMKLKEKIVIQNQITILTVVLVVEAAELLVRTIHENIAIVKTMIVLHHQKNV